MTSSTRFALQMVRCAVEGFVGVLNAAADEAGDTVKREHIQKAAGYLADALYRLDLVPEACPATASK